MTTPAKLNEYSQAEEPARVLLGGPTFRGRRWRLRIGRDSQCLN